jgi:protein-histidine N-methyltransferase
VNEHGPMDIILSSETIYRSASLHQLIPLLREASLDKAKGRKTICLVAAKVIYFGVGGGIDKFVDAVGKIGGGKADTVWETKEGVARRILSITWS